MFHEVYFRIESGYQWGNGMSSEKYKKFNDEICKLFSKNGWEIVDGKSSGVCPSAEYGKSKLYLHPTQISGPCDDSLVYGIEKMLKNGKTFEFITTDIYSQLYDMNDEEYADYLNSKRNDIEKLILTSCKTQRKNLFVYEDTLLMGISEKIKVKRITDYMGICYPCLESEFAKNVFEDLLSKGKIVSAELKKGGIGYRTA